MWMCVSVGSVRHGRIPDDATGTLEASVEDHPINELFYQPEGITLAQMYAVMHQDPVRRGSSMPRFPNPSIE